MEYYLILAGLIVFLVVFIIVNRRDLVFLWDDVVIPIWRKLRLNYFRKVISKEKSRLKKAKMGLAKLLKVKSQEVFDDWEDKLDDARYFLGASEGFVNAFWESLNREKEDFLEIRKRILKAKEIIRSYEKYVKKEKILV